ncbi:twin-arginine translocation pathway signal [Rhodopseudomonas sp. NSM]|uniref:twin-arginine translocation pathway signal n=1 Tax=Rhodopseudomonas sp. NSM TaxID=3457630 RepID=UPI004037252A
MTDRRRLVSSRLGFVAFAALVVGAGGLSGCAAIGDSAMSQAFVDPAKYDLYNCEQLAAERKALDARLADLDGLMRKAQTGVAGSVVSEVAYRNDYINVKAQSRLAEQTWRDNKCVEAAPPPAAAAPGPRAPAHSGRTAR